jgi:hypothetical protein
MIWDYCAAGKLDELATSCLMTLSMRKPEEAWATFTRPSWGGEYLPKYHRHEVEIARIELQSTTSDVISLRARGSGLRIKYRLVDEYQTEFGLAQQTSQRPFSLRELIVFLDSAKHYDGDPNWLRFGFPLRR